MFTRTKHRANRLWEFLEKRGINVARIHGNRSQAQRTDALDGFKAGRYRVLVATDIAARGIDVEALGHVVNFDVPARAGGLHPSRRPHGARRADWRSVHVRRAGGGRGPPRDRARDRESAAARDAAGLRLQRAAGGEVRDSDQGAHRADSRAAKADERARAKAKEQRRTARRRQRHHRAASSRPAEERDGGVRGAAAGVEAARAAAVREGHTAARDDRAGGTHSP